MTNLLYIGNKLVSEKTNITSIDTLGTLLSDEGYNVKYASDKKNTVIRLLHMFYTIMINRRSVDYVLIDTYSTLNFYYAFFVSQICRLCNLKYIPILHGGNLPNRIERSPVKSKMIFDNAHRNVSPSIYIKENFEKKGYRNIEFIPNTLEIDKYPYKRREKVDAKLLWVRSFKAIYNPLMAVRVAKRLLDSKITTSLCMVGPFGDDTFALAKDLAQNLNVEVNFTGKLSQEDWIELSRNYDVFINTSDYDNMPVSLIEAMALGLPVITTNVGGIPSLVKDGENAILINPNDHNAMAMAIGQLNQDPEKVQKLSRNGRINAENFDWNVVKEKWNSLLK
jgi:glycosyltransferase involved in cell wall biosynthesis